MKRATKRAVSRSREFWGFAPRSIDQMELEYPQALVHLGVCSQINYVCDKEDGKPREYFHRFETPVDVFAADRGQPDGRELLIIVGQFKITKKGIEG